MGYQTLTLEITDRIATLRLNRPQELNALNNQMALDLLDAMAVLARETDLMVVIITGAGQAFAAGKDLREELEAPAEERVPIDWPEKACSLFRSIGKAVIASINGPAVGFGFGLCLACDIRIAAESARVGMGFLGAGMTPGFGATYFLPRLVGLGKACELAFTNKTISAREAERIGLVDRVVADSDLNRATYELASAVAGSAPIALKLTKQAIYQGLESDLLSQLHFETTTQMVCSKTADHVEAMRSFMEKRKPVFEGR